MSNLVDSDELASSYFATSKQIYNSGLEVPETNREKEVDISKILDLILRPESVAIIKEMQNTRVNCLARVLFDPGADDSY